MSDKCESLQLTYWNEIEHHFGKLHVIYSQIHTVLESSWTCCPVNKSMVGYTLLNIHDVKKLNLSFLLLCPYNSSSPPPPPKTTWLDSELLHQLCASRGSPYTRGVLRRPVKIAFQLSCTIRTSQISQHAESIPLAFQLQKNTFLPPLKLSDTMGFCCLVFSRGFWGLYLWDWA